MQAEATQAARVVHHRGSPSWVCFSPAVPCPGSSYAALAERVEKQRRWTSSVPLAWARIKDMHASVFPYRNWNPGPVLLSAITYPLVYQDRLITCYPVQTL